MEKLINGSVIILGFVLMSTQIFGQMKSETFTVYGNCGMCKTTIEKAITDVAGIQSGAWDMETGIMSVSFDKTKITLSNIKQKIADVGYDSDTHRAKDEVYNALHGCCQYERPAKLESDPKSLMADDAEEFKVYGNCGMCKKTIENSLKDVKGVHSGVWDMDEAMMTVNYDKNIISLDDIKQKIADVGYDSDTHRAKDEVYDALHGCCQYERPKQ